MNTDGTGGYTRLECPELEIRSFVPSHDPLHSALARAVCDILAFTYKRPSKGSNPCSTSPAPPHAQRDQAHTSVNRRGKQAVAGKQCLFVQLPAQPLTDRDHQDTACSLPN